VVITDYSQIALAAIYADSAAQDCAKHPSDESRNMIKHFMLNSIRYNYVQHKAKFGGMVIACDSNKGYWRREYFENYKVGRRMAKAKGDDTGIEWNFVFSVIDETINDLQTYFPFVTLRIPGAEGDDIIGVLTEHLSTVETTGETDIFGDAAAEPILILSSDGDNYQLHENSNVKQFSPRDKKLVKPPVPPREALITKIVKGDPGDSVPNIRMGDNTFADGIRQLPISSKLLETFIQAKNPIDACTSDEMRKNFIRNETLVSYKKIPPELRAAIISAYNEASSKKKSKMELMNYLTRHKMANLLGAISDFY
jgi:hypothetical protein